MEFIIKKSERPYKIVYTLIMLLAIACTKNNEEPIKVKAPLRSYIITARIDNKQAGTDSKGTGILKGTYSEKTKLFTYTLYYENLLPTSINITKGTKGALGVVVIKLMQSENAASGFQLTGETRLSSLQERDLIKGLWFVTIGSAKYSVCEIRGQVTIKQNMI